MKNKGKTPMRACVIGYPIKHSLSPLLHGRWISTLDLEAEYTACHATPEAFTETVKRLFDGPTFVGMNVTLPHKQAALALAEEASEGARRAGAANLLYRKNGKTYAENTDIEGLVAPLLERRPAEQWRGTRLVIIGAGGAARAAVIGALKLNPASIEVINRTDARANALAQSMGANVYARRWADRQNIIQGAALLINASAAGMKGNAPLELSPTGLDQGALIYDLVYTPLITPLLRDAKNAGYATLGGLDMLIAQARPSFEALFGVPAPKNPEVKHMLIRALEGAA